MEGTAKINLVCIREGRREQAKDMVARELLLTIILNDQELVTLLCSPTKLDSLAVGFLFSEGLIRAKEDIKKVVLDERRGIVRVKIKEPLDLATETLFKRFITSRCGRGASFYQLDDVQSLTKVESPLKVSANRILALAREFQQHSQVYKATGGVHSAALCSAEGILIFQEDIGRHNAVDKIFGESLLKNISTEDKMLFTSGRISSEILLKATKGRIPILASISAPTELAIRMANELKVTLIGFVRGRRMNIYAGEWRVS